MKKLLIAAILAVFTAPLNAQNPDAGKVEVGKVIGASGPPATIRLTPTASTVPIFNGTTLVNSSALGAAAYVGTSTGGLGASDSGKALLFGASGGAVLTDDLVVKETSIGTYPKMMIDLSDAFSAPGLHYQTGALAINKLTFATGAGATVVTVPAITGTLITTGDTGTVTNTMLAGSIDPSKITGTAAILGSNTFTGAQIASANGAASTPSMKVNGTVFTGGTATTTKPLVLIEPSASTSTNWGTGGTLLGINSSLSGSATAFIDLQTGAGTSVNRIRIHNNGSYAGISLYSPTGVEMFVTNQYSTFAIGSGTTANNVSLFSNGTAEQAGYYCLSSNGVTTYFALMQTGTAHQLQLGASATTDANANDQLLKAADAAPTTGTNRDGADLTIASGNSTGSGTSALIFSTPAAGASGTAERTAAERVRINSSGLVIGGSSGPVISSGSGSPESVVTAPVGSLFLRTDGGASTTLYVKESGAGNTGWVAK